MPTTPYAKVLVSIAGDTPTAGGRVAAAGQPVSLSLENPSGASLVLWEIFSYPPGWGPPAGWALGPSGRAYRASTIAGASPPSFSLPSSATYGKWLFRATVNSALRNGVYDPTLVDETSGVRTPGPFGIRGLGVSETTQFSSDGGWASDLDLDLRALVAASGGGSGATAGAPLAKATVPFPSSGVTTSTLLFTVPGTPAGNARALLTLALARIDTATVGGGSGTLAIGTTPGGQELLKLVTLSGGVAAGTLYGLDTADLGSSMTSAGASKNYAVAVPAGQNIYATTAVSGSLTGGVEYVLDGTLL